MPAEVQRTATGALVVVDGEVRATFVGNLDDPAERAAFDEMVRELFPTLPIVLNFEDFRPL
jgi:hypothetical protein